MLELNNIIITGMYQLAPNSEVDIKVLDRLRNTGNNYCHRIEFQSKPVVIFKRPVNNKTNHCFTSKWQFSLSSNECKRNVHVFVKKIENPRVSKNAQCLIQKENTLPLPEKLIYV